MFHKKRTLSAMCLVLSLLFPKVQGAQSSTTRCYEMLGEITCRTTDDNASAANGWSVVAAVFKGMAEADEKMRRQKLEAEQRQLLDEQLRQLQAADAARVALDAAEQARRKAQQRLYWSRATNVLVEVSDSLDFDTTVRKALVDRSQDLLYDLLTVNPQASSHEIHDNLRPVINELYRVDRAFHKALIGWVQANVGLLRTVSPLERGEIEGKVAEAKVAAATVTSPGEVDGVVVTRLDLAKKWILDNRKSCMDADSCYLEYLPPLMRRTVDSLRAVAVRKNAARELAEKRRLASRERAALAADSAAAARERLQARARSSAAARLRASLPRYTQYAELDSVGRLLFIRALDRHIAEVSSGDSLPSLLLIEQAKSSLATAIDWCKGTVSCDSLLVSDAVFGDFARRRKEKMEREAAEARSLRCVAAPLTCSENDVLEIYMPSFLWGRTNALHPDLTRAPFTFRNSVAGNDTTLEWSNKASQARIAVTRKQVVSSLNDRRPSKLITWNYILGGNKGSYYQAETVELLFDEQTLALVDFKHAVFARGGALRDQTPSKSCVSQYRSGSEWISRGPGGERFTIAARNGLSLPPVALFALAHLSWPYEGEDVLVWGATSTVSVSPKSMSFFGIYPAVQKGKDKADLVLKNSGDGSPVVAGGFLVRPILWGNELSRGALSREFDRWYLTDTDASCVWG